MIDGKLVKEIWFANGDRVASGNGHTMKVINDFHGQYDIDWIALFDEAGKEIRRWNATCSSVEGIEWEEMEKEGK
jgi:hypothetical protein